jgi:hypothetical protein
MAADDEVVASESPRRATGSGAFLGGEIRRSAMSKIASAPVA